MDGWDGQVYDKFDLGHGQNCSKVAGMRDTVFGGLRRGALQVEIGAGQNGDVREADEVRQVLVASGAITARRTACWPVYQVICFL